eukprot:1710705-Amphidinium_carterae.2
MGAATPAEKPDYIVSPLPLYMSILSCRNFGVSEAKTAMHCCDATAASRTHLGSTRNKEQGV